MPCFYQLPGSHIVFPQPWRVNAVSAAPPLLTHFPHTTTTSSVWKKKQRNILYVLYILLRLLLFLHCFLSWNDFIIIIRYFCEFKTHYPYPLVQQNTTIITSVRVMGSSFPQMSLFWVSALTVRIHTAERSHVTLAFGEELDEGWHAASLWGVVFFARSNPCICLLSLASQLEWMCPNHSLLI